MKTVLITGAAQGIGLATADYFLARGWRVLAVDRNEQQGQEAVRVRSSLPFQLYTLDLVKKSDLDQLIDQLRQEAISLDGLVHNAMWQGGGFSSCSYEDFLTTLKIGLVAPFYLTRELLPLMTPAAAVVNVASTRASMCQPEGESYAAAKGGLLSLTRALAMTLAGRVRVNSVSPGWIDSHGETLNPSEADRLSQPVGRIGQNEDVAALIYFLLSEEAGFINGEDIRIDGGMSRQMIYSGEYGWSFEPSKKQEDQA